MSATVVLKLFDFCCNVLLPEGWVLSCTAPESEDTWAQTWIIKLPELGSESGHRSQHPQDKVEARQLKQGCAYFTSSLQGALYLGGEHLTESNSEVLQEAQEGFDTVDDKRPASPYPHVIPEFLYFW